MVLGLGMNGWMDGDLFIAFLFYFASGKKGQRIADLRFRVVDWKLVFCRICRIGPGQLC
jgi:hypothetical protein